MRIQFSVLPDVSTRGDRTRFPRGTLQFLATLAEIFDEMQELRRQAQKRFPQLMEL